MLVSVSYGFGRHTADIVANRGMETVVQAAFYQIMGYRKGLSLCAQHLQTADQARSFQPRLLLSFGSWTGHALSDVAVLFCRRLQVTGLDHAR